MHLRAGVKTPSHGVPQGAHDPAEGPAPAGLHVRGRPGGRPSDAEGIPRHSPRRDRFVVVCTVADAQERVAPIPQGLIHPMRLEGTCVTVRALRRDRPLPVRRCADGQEAVPPIAWARKSSIAKPRKETGPWRPGACTDGMAPVRTPAEACRIGGFLQSLFKATITR